MKWYETSLTAQFDNAIKLSQQGRSEAYVKAIRRIRTLMIEREKQVRCDLEMTSVLSLNSDRPSAKQKRASARQALDKILREMRRRTYVYDFDDCRYY